MNRALLVGVGLGALAVVVQSGVAADIPRPLTKASDMVAAPIFDWTG